MRFDLRDLRPSEAKGLSVFLEDIENQKDFVEKLVAFLADLNPASETDTDQAVAVSHELSASGVWENLDRTLLVKGMAQVNRATKSIFFSKAPIDLEQLILTAPNGVFEVDDQDKSERHRPNTPDVRGPAGSVKHISRPRTSVGGETTILQKKFNQYHHKTAKKKTVASTKNISFRVAFVSQQVRETLVIGGGVELKQAEFDKLCTTLHHRSRMHVVGIPWSATVHRGGDQEFIVGELVRSDANLLLRSSTRLYHGVEFSTRSIDLTRSIWHGSKGNFGTGGTTASIADVSTPRHNPEQTRKKK